MTSKIKALEEPFILTESFLKRHLLEVIKKAEVKKVIEEDGLDLSTVLNLDLERLYILNITCLWRFTSLEILKMPNNIIEKIGGLDNLIHLKELDLSFNYIEIITGLENLVNLKKINLTSNEITVIENMENLKKLEIFLIRHNRIKFFDSILYLRQFKNLIYLGIQENPVIQSEDDVLHVIAALPRLKYLDHRLIFMKEEALAKFPINTRGEISEEAKVARNQADITDEEQQILVTMEEMKTLHMNAYVDGLINGQLFDSMFEDDENGSLIISFTPAQAIADEYRMKMELICQEWFDYGLKINEYREKEKESFKNSVDSVRVCVSNDIRQDISDWLSFRGQTLKELGSIYVEKSEKVIKDKVAELKETCNNKLSELWRKVLKSTALRVELIQVMSQNLLHALSEIDQKYLDEIEKYPPMLEEVDEKFATCLKEFYNKWFDEGSNLNEVKDIIEPDREFLRMIEDHDFIEISLSNGRSAHLSVIAEKMQLIKSRMKSSMIDKLKEIEEEENKNYKENTKEVTLFCNDQFCDIALFFLSLEMEDPVI